VIVYYVCRKIAATRYMPVVAGPFVSRRKAREYKEAAEQSSWGCCCVVRRDVPPSAVYRAVYSRKPARIPHSQRKVTL
jgi:hypothetical protein